MYFNCFYAFITVSYVMWLYRFLVWDLAVRFKTYHTNWVRYYAKKKINSHIFIRFDSENSRSLTRSLKGGKKGKHLAENSLLKEPQYKQGHVNETFIQKLLYALLLSSLLLLLFYYMMISISFSHCLCAGL